MISTGWAQFSHVSRFAIRYGRVTTFLESVELPGEKSCQGKLNAFGSKTGVYVY